ncbi:MAG TPA: AAA family ATPase [Chloroflexi bacterium]|nr:AAA family ATPase [Chloroflexota bacterium]
MLKRIYIDNFRGLVNFELPLDSINLLLGPNGSGKSTVFDALRKIQAFVSGDYKVATLFEGKDLTRWQNSPIQSFELEIEGNSGTYKYELAILHEIERPFKRVQVHYERLWFDDKPLLKVEPSGDACFYQDDYSEGPIIPFDLPQSLLGIARLRDDNTRLIWFKKRMARFLIVQIIPGMMVGGSNREDRRLAANMENFVSWYRTISQNQGKMIEITNALKEILDGFEYFRFLEAGVDHRFLGLSFSGEEGSYDYLFTELSDGQRMLIALYTLLYATRSEDYTLCIDEPENFLALPEIQPWLATLYDLCSAGETQALLISHHPELIDYLAASDGYWFDYQSNTPVRVKRIGEQQEGSLPISELVARGWLNE